MGNGMAIKRSIHPTVRHDGFQHDGDDAQRKGFLYWILCSSVGITIRGQPLNAKPQERQLTSVDLGKGLGRSSRYS